jgi:hypothetical protein
LHAVTVGHIRNQLPASRPCILGASWFAVLVGVCNNENSVSPVRGTDARSRIMEREHFVSCTLQVRKHTLEDHTSIERKQSRNILCHDVCRG